VKEASANWLTIAKKDLKVAQDNYKIENYLTCVEKCHAALEKLLKGIIAENNNSPSRIHNLLRLASEAVISNLQDDTKKLFDELSDCYISIRYPDEYYEVEKEYNQEKTNQIPKETKRVFSWLEKKLEQN